MFMTSSEIGDHLLKSRQVALRDLATNYVQLLSMETQSIDFLVAAIQQKHPNHPNIALAKEEVVKAEEALTHAIRASATHEALAVESFQGCAKGEKTAESIRARFQLMMKKFEAHPSSDAKMVEMQDRIAKIIAANQDEPDTARLEAELTKFATDPLITYLDSKQLEGHQFGFFDRIIAQWADYESYISLGKQINSYRDLHEEVSRNRRERLSELKDIVSARTLAYRREARERIAKELNVAMVEVDKFDRHDEARQLAVTSLYKSIDLFQARYFIKAIGILGLSDGSEEAKTAKAFHDQLNASSHGNRTSAVSLRDKYRKVTELFRLIRQHFAFEHRYRFETPLEFDEWLSNDTLNAEDILERMIDRVPEVEEKMRLKAS
jgi:hypothetical protein